MTDAGSNGHGPPPRWLARQLDEPFFVRNDLHFIPRIALPQPRDPEIGLTTTEDGGW